MGTGVGFIVGWRDVVMKSEVGRGGNGGSGEDKGWAVWR